MGYNVGDRVRIVSDKSGISGWNSNGRMDKWLGKVMTIRKIEREYTYRMVEDYHDRDNDSLDGRGWYWYDDMIEGFVERATEEQQTISSKYKIGDLVRVRADLKNGNFYQDVYCAYEMEGYKGKIVKIVDVIPISYEGGCYVYNIEDSSYSWVDSMFKCKVGESK